LRPGGINPFEAGVVTEFVAAAGFGPAETVRATMLRFGRPEIWLAAGLLLAAAAIAETAALAQGASPLTFLEQLYKPYRANKNAKAVDYSKPDTVRRYFGPELAKAMLRDRTDAKKRNEVPLLNGDPFIDAQDWEIADLKIEMQPGTTRRNATGVVTFTNAGEPRAVTVDLIKTGDGWRIYEINAPSGSLRGLYKLKP
jgi:hypothetical protein